MNNETRYFPIIETFYRKIFNNQYVLARGGVKTVEQLAVTVELDPKQAILDFGVKKTNEEYCQKELAWYLSLDCNITGYVDDVKIWKQVADKYGFVNSNYGWCIYSHKNYWQFESCLKELLDNEFSRRAVMIYNRPSMWQDYNENGRDDFMCTMHVSCFIRDNKLVYIIHQRSADFVFGSTFNDFYWHCYVYNELYSQLLNQYKNLKVGSIFHIFDSLHVYERHWELLKKIYKNKDYYFKKEE